MFRILVDTCVWLDAAKDPKQIPVLGVVEELVKQHAIELIVPRIVLDEFSRNRDRISKESEKSLSSHFKLVRDAAGRASGDEQKLASFLEQLDEVAHRIPQIGGHAVETLNRIEILLSSAHVIETSDAAKLRAAHRALEKVAPFHHDKNSIGDAIIIETYGECVSAKDSSGLRFAFVTHNKRDFSQQNGNHNEPHPDLLNFFSRIKSRYFLNLAEALRRVDPTLVTDLMIEQAWESEPRSLSEMLEAEDLLVTQIWYNRHKIRQEKIARGEIRIVKNPSIFSNDIIKEEIWIGALKSAEKVEESIGIENLGPWSDFEWGMLNGKLSAIRWMMGDEWDMLYT